MAGRGRRPGEASTRSVQVVRTYVDVPQRPKPLPRPAPQGGWSPVTKRAWREATAAPWSVLWGPLDLAVVERWARLHHRLASALDDDGASLSAVRALSAELRALEDGLGMTPAGRARLRWYAEGRPDLGAEGGAVHGATVTELRARATS